MARRPTRSKRAAMPLLIQFLKGVCGSFVVDSAELLQH